jgi:hypothetical protein
MLMNVHRLAGFVVVCLLTAAGAGAPLAGAAVPAPEEAAATDAAPLFRVFLKEGGSLVSYGEYAQLDGRVVFSMPTSASTAAPQLQLINLSSDRVDWERTIAYAESVRASRYLATRAEADYTQLTTAIAQALNDVALTNDAVSRLAIVERARKTLGDWPAAHYNYKHDEVQQMLGMLDEAIADLRAAAGANSFDLRLVATAGPPPPYAPLLPPPTAREAIEQTLVAARATDSPAERMSLLTVAATAIDSGRAELPADWATTTRAAVAAEIAHETEVDRRYKAMGARMLRLATARAALADVRGVQRVLSSVRANDAALGSARPETVASIAAAVEAELEAARRLRLERDRWALRAPELRAYRDAVAASLQRLQRIAPLLEDIKALAGSGPDAIGAILGATSLILGRIPVVTPPDELRDAHALLLSAARLADNAARVRREAALTGSMARAWDASSAAAGALMLATRARNDILLALRPPQLTR